MKREAGFAPIDSYAAIGDGRTVALVAADGSVGLHVVADASTRRRRSPRSSTPSAADASPSHPSGSTRPHAAIVGRTNVLETTYRTGDGVVRITEAPDAAGRRPAALGGATPGASRGSRDRSRSSGGSSPASTGGASRLRSSAAEISRRRRRGSPAGRPLLGRRRRRGRRRTPSPAPSSSPQVDARCWRSSPRTNSRFTRRDATMSRRGSTRRAGSGSAGSARGPTTARGRRRSRAARSRSSSSCTRRPAASRLRRRRPCRR